MTHWSLVWLLNWRHVVGLSIFAVLLWSAIFVAYTNDGGDTCTGAGVATFLCMLMFAVVAVLLLAMYLVTT